MSEFTKMLTFGVVELHLAKAALAMNNAKSTKLAFDRVNISQFNY